MKPHQHLIVTGFLAAPPKKEQMEEVEWWYSKLISSIGMFELAPPKAVYCDDPENRGMTASVLLTTSHSALHVWDDVYPARFEFDLYSCSEIKLDVVWKALDQFMPVKREYMFLDRTSGLKTISTGK